MPYTVLLWPAVLEVWWRQYYPGGSAPPKHMPGHQLHLHLHSLGGGAGTHVPTSVDAIACGLEAGACFGFSAAACRTGGALGGCLGACG